jgi:hypothetical protein
MIRARENSSVHTSREVPQCSLINRMRSGKVEAMEEDDDDEEAEEEEEEEEEED